MAEIQMIAIGERINATRKSVAEALKARDAGFVRAEVTIQLRGAAAMLDINGATNPEEEIDNAVWLTGIVAAKSPVPLCFDSANPAVLEAAVEKCIEVRGMSVPESWEAEPGLPWLMLNSITAEEKRYESVLPLVKRYNCAVVALCMGEELPTSAEARIEVGSQLVENLMAEGIAPGRIFIDPLVMPIGVNTENAMSVFEVIEEMKRRYPDVKSVCGLSNISYGMPGRALINRHFLTLMIGAGLDAAILDTSDIKVMSALYAAIALRNRDPYCAGFIKAFREKRLEV